MADDPTMSAGAESTDQAPADTRVPAPKGIEAARLDLRDVGFCVGCDRFVERCADGSCPKGHEGRLIAGRTLLAEGDDMPRMPRFNLGAFLLPPFWGAWYGQWIGIFFVPLWIFALDAFESAQRKGGFGWYVGAAVLFAATLAFQTLFAVRANGLAWRAVCEKVSLEAFVKRQRLWAVAGVVVWLLVGGWLAAWAAGVRF